MGKTKALIFSLLLAATASAAPHRPHKPAHSAARTSARHRPTTTASRRPKTAKHTRKHAASAAVARHSAPRRHSAVRPVAVQRHKARPATAHGHLAAHRRPARQPQPSGRAYTVTATVYQAVAGQTDASPFITADNSRIRPRYGSHTRWLALSPDLLKQGGGKFNYGDKVQVGGVSPQLDGVYTVHDTMNRRHRHRIDILTHRREKLHVYAPGAKLRLAQAPRKSRAQATAAAHARPGRHVAKSVAGHQPRRLSRQQAS